MYAVIEVAGVQCKVAGEKTIRVPKLEIEPGKSLELDRVLLVVDEDKVNIGKPLVANVKVKATVVAHGKADKVKVFKKKRRKNYKVLKGHRQEYTEIRIDSIGIDGEKKTAPEKPAQKKITDSRPADKVTEVKVKTEQMAPAKTEAKPKSTSAKPKTAANKSSSPKKETKG
jgi:large subunit ribosomal protein L21